MILAETVLPVMTSLANTAYQDWHQILRLSTADENLWLLNYSLQTLFYMVALAWFPLIVLAYLSKGRQIKWVLQPWALVSVSFALAVSIMPWTVRARNEIFRAFAEATRSVRFEHAVQDVFTLSGLVIYFLAIGGSFVITIGGLYCLARRRASVIRLGLLLLLVCDIANIAFIVAVVCSEGWLAVPEPYAHIYHGDSFLSLIDAASTVAISMWIVVILYELTIHDRKRAQDARLTTQ